MLTSTPPLLTEELPLKAEPEELQGAALSRLHNPAEVHQVLAGLIAKRAIVSLYPEKPGVIASLPLLGIDGHQLILALPEEAERAAVFDARQLLCVGLQDRIKLQFEVGYPRLVEWQRQPALAVTAPASILRLQRRDHYRLTIPLSQPLSAFVPLQADGEEEIEVSIIDLSLGGMGILAFIPGLRLVPGARYHGIRVELPHMASVAVDAQVRSRFELVLRNGIRTVRTGFEFTPLPPASRQQIQHYINRIEHPQQPAR
ncbi:flagellar brake protein [Chitinimonas sp.]|uniref:flagellar brake protein n=1 Tax=Chitinimonas sp. TaxID=1934313 RepID=UPI002F9209C0